MSSELLSLIALLIALTSTVINYLLLRIQRDPEVIVYAIPDVMRSSIINLIIENTGKGVAENVRFKSNRPIPTRAFGFDDAPVPKNMSDGPLINGIPSFGTGEKRIITWGQYGGLKKGLGDYVLCITAIYYSKPPLRIRQQRHETTSHIDLRSFEGTDASERNWGKKISEQLEKIATILSKFVDKEK